MIKAWRSGSLIMVLALSTVLGGCASRDTRVERYVSSPAVVQGEAAKINLDEVQKAFWDTKGTDFNSWMGAFEKRVNEIYDGKEVVSVDATHKEGKLAVVGYIDTKKQQGFVNGDEKLFSIEQTGDAVNNELPIRVSDADNRPYYEGHHSILDNPFFQMMFVSHLMGGWGGRYYTPYNRVVVLHDYRNSYRSTPQYGQQQASNQGFFSRFKKNSAGGLQSSKTFGGSDFSSASGATAKRSWWGGSSPASAPTASTAATSSASSSSGWGMRRSSGTSIFGGGSSSGMRSSGRSWGGFRRR
ncbi:MAG: hypothetical protein P4L53_03405 [Candidatus Obscuribacterales bacterium]|nr:hypothetical protein [Candidatus Obscuribacterales bacterium]